MANTKQPPLNEVVTLPGGQFTRAWSHWFSFLEVDSDTKADKVVGAVADNVASLDSDGNLEDSGIAKGDVLEPSDILPTVDKVEVTDNGDGTVTLTISDNYLPNSVAGTTDKITVTDDGDGTITLTISDNYLPNSIAGTAGEITVTDDGDGTITLSIPSAAVITFANTGLHILDTNASHDLIISPGSDLTADRTLTITTGDSDRTITLSGSPTLSDWFDQSVKQAASPTFAGFTKVGGASDYVEVESDGDVNFVGGGGLQFGEIYADDNSTTVDLAAQDTYYQVTIFSTNGQSNGAVTPDHTNDHITAGVTGKYLVNISLTAYSAQSNEYYFAVFVNNGDTEYSNLESVRQTTVASKPGSCSISGIASFTANDTVELWVKRTDGAAVSKSITISHINMSIVLIGG